MSPRARAFTAVLRARGWVDEAVLERAAVADEEVDQRLMREGHLTIDQVASIWEAIDGPVEASRGSINATMRAPSSGAFDGSIRRSDSDATLTPSPGRLPMFGAARPAPGAADPEATVTPSSNPGGSAATIRPAGKAASEAFLQARTGRIELPSEAGRTPASGSYLALSEQLRTADRFGPYKLMRELGRGGMGVVYRAMHLDLRREVALKVMLTPARETDPDTQRFRQEAALVAKLGAHPHLVAVHEIGIEMERLYFTMDYIDGRSVRQRLDDDGALPPREAARICAEIASGLEFVHRAGVVHRDVKPHNVLEDRQGRAFLTDFGLAKDTGGPGGLTVSGTALGTPAYMSPEVAGYGGKRATALSDVYSLGATLYEMLTRKPPFTGTSGVELVRAVVEQDPAPPRSLRPDIHPDLEVIVQKAMHKEPHRRYGSAAEMERDLRRFLHGEPIHARPIGSIERLAIRVRRHRTVLSAGLLGLAIAGLGVAWGLWKSDARERTAREKKEEARRRAEKAAPLLLEGRSLIGRSEQAAQSGAWADRDAHAAAAVQVLAEAAAVVPDDAEVRYELGRALRRAGRVAEARAELERAVALRPQHVLAWFEHGMIAQEALLQARGSVSRNLIVQRTNELGYRSKGAPAFQVGLEAAGGPTDEALRASAARDFEQVAAAGAGAGAGKSEYGRAVVAFLANDFQGALARLEASLKEDPYFVPSLRLQADILEAWTRDVSRGLEARKRLHDLHPRHPEYALDYALSLSVLGRREEALAIVGAALEGRDDAALFASGGWIYLACEDFAGATRCAKRSMELSEKGRARAEAVLFAAEVLVHQKRTDDAVALVDANAGDFAEEWLPPLKAGFYRSAGRYGPASRELRKVKRGTATWRGSVFDAAWVEWMCGNLDLAEACAEEAVKIGYNRSNRGVVRMDADNLAGAIEDFRHEVTKNATADDYANLAGALFLDGQYPEAIDTLKASYDASSIPDHLKKGMQGLFKNMRASAEKAKTAKAAAKVPESLLGLLQLGAAQSAADPLAQATAREGQRGILYALQEFYWIHGMPKDSAGAGARHLALMKSGNILFKHARACAALGDTAAALQALRDAMDEGFDDGKRLDGEPAFDVLRPTEGYREVRGKCR